MNDVWPMVHAERAALIDDLAGLDAQQWQQQSLCDQWSVHDVLAHLVDTARATRTRFVAGLARARFDFDRQNERGVQRERKASPVQTLERFRQVASRTSTPPALRYQARTPASFGGAKELTSQIRITATDADVSIGNGPGVSGTTLSLLLVISGRRAALDNLDGSGADSLAKLTRPDLT